MSDDWFLLSIVKMNKLLLELINLNSLIFNGSQVNESFLQPVSNPPVMNSLVSESKVLTTEPMDCNSTPTDSPAHVTPTIEDRDSVINHCYSLLCKVENKLKLLQNTKRENMYHIISLDLPENLRWLYSKLVELKLIIHVFLCELLQTTLLKFCFQTSPVVFLIYIY